MDKETQRRQAKDRDLKKTQSRIILKEVIFSNFGKGRKTLSTCTVQKEEALTGLVGFVWSACICLERQACPSQRSAASQQARMLFSAPRCAICPPWCGIVASLQRGASRRICSGCGGSRGQVLAGHLYGPSNDDLGKEGLLAAAGSCPWCRRWRGQGACRKGFASSASGLGFHPLDLQGAELHGSMSQVFRALLLDSFRQVVWVYCWLYWEILFLLEVTQLAFFFWQFCFSFVLELNEISRTGKLRGQDRLIRRAEHAMYVRVTITYYHWDWEEEERECHLPPICFPLPARCFLKQFSFYLSQFVCSTNIATYNLKNVCLFN